MRQASDYVYRGHDIQRTTRQSKNWRFGDLHFWWVPALDRERDGILASLGRDGRSLFQNKIDAERAVDEALDGPLKDRACVEGARIVVDNPGRTYRALRGMTGTVRAIEYEARYGNTSSPDHATVLIDGGDAVRLPTYTFKPIPPPDMAEAKA
jgi:hypothetical protein